MNSKGIKAIEDTSVCMKCLKNKATHTYQIAGRGYGSIFDMERTKFQCCDECDKPEYKKWFNEKPKYNDYIEEYEYENEIWSLIKNLPLESRELFENRFSSDNWMDSQEWIDYELNELPYEKCNEYDLIAPQDIKAYKTKFTTCEHVINVVYKDNSKSSQCPFGAFGEYGQKINEHGNVCCQCTNCKYYKLRESKINEINGDDSLDWRIYMTAKIKEKEYKDRFEN